MKKEEYKFPKFFPWLFKKWYFWMIFFVYSFWSGYEAFFIYKSFSESIGVLVATFIITSFFFLFAFLIGKSILRDMKEDLRNTKKE